MSRKFADEVLDTTADTLCYLRDRWQDEKDYEDFADYTAVIENKLATIDGVTFIEMTKRPWGFKWRATDGFERHTRIKGRHVETIRIGLN